MSTFIAWCGTWIYTDVARVVIGFIEALIISVLVGLDREKTRRPAGLRTHVIVTLGACAITLACTIFPVDGHSDVYRIPAQVLSGIGFIGAGTILRYKDNVIGLTTAASLWTSAVIGVCAGLGAHWVVLFGSLLFFLTLKIVPSIERRFLRKTVLFDITVTAGENKKDLQKVSQLIKDKDIQIRSVNMNNDKYGNKLYEFALGARNDQVKTDFINELYLLDVSAVKEDKDEFSED